MRFLPTSIAGVFLIEPDLIRDQRGFFTRLYCPREMATVGIDFLPQQTSLSRNDKQLTLRGMHFCSAPEAKLVRCVSGRIHDVALDLREDSPTFGRAISAELDAKAARALYIPAGVAHGFLTLEDHCDVLYQIDRIYSPGHDAGVRWDDPAFSIAWPCSPAVISERDLSYPDFATPPVTA